MRKKFTLIILIVLFLIIDNGLVASAQLVLSITNPAPVCSPATVDITASAITAGSTFPGGTTLSYYTDVGATIPLSSPAAITTANTYYIKAVNGGSTDIEPVVVTINPTPILIIQQPNAVCAPTTVDITNPEIAINHSTLPPGTVLNYYEDAATTTPLTMPEAISTNGNYYITATAASCVSYTGVVAVTINARPPAPAVADLAYCQFTAVPPLTATAIPGNTLIWYTQPVGGSSSFSAPIPSTDNGDVTLQYYVGQEQTFGATTCISATRSELDVRVTAQPTLSITNPSPACSPATVDITAPHVVATTGSATLSYYTDAADTDPLTSPSTISASGIYYIKATGPTGCSDSSAVVVSISNSCSAAPIPNPVSVSPSPADQTLYISFNADETGAGYFELINDKGQIVIDQAILFGPIVTINIAALPTGKYYYAVRNPDGKKIKTGKVLIIR